MNPLTTTLFALLLPLTAAADPGGARVEWVGGEPVEGPIEEIDGDGIRIGGRTIPLDAVLRVDFPGGGAVRAPGPVTVVLLGGDRIHGRPGGFADGAVTLGRTVVGDLTLPTDRLKGILFRERFDSGEQVDAFLADLAEAPPPESDVLHLVEGDRVPVIVDRIAGGEVVAEFQGVERTFPLDRLRAIRFFEFGPPPAADGVQLVVRLADGGLLTGTPEGVRDGKLLLRTAIEPPLEIPTDAIRWIGVRGAAYVFCSDLDPVEVDERPFVVDTETPLSEHILFRYRRDRTVIDAAPLTLRGRVFPKGLGVHSYSAITYDLVPDTGPRFTRFIATIGVDDAVLPHGRPEIGYGSVVFRILLDGEEAWSSDDLLGRPVTARDDAIPVRIDLGDAERMTLVVDFGDLADILDRADWAGAVLVR